MNSNRILCSRNCLENIYALKKEIILYFSFLEVGGRWGGGVVEGGGVRKGFYAAVHLMWFILPERELKVS